MPNESTHQEDQLRIAQSSAQGESPALEEVPLDVLRGEPTPENPCASISDSLLRLYEILTESKQPTLERAELFTLTGDSDNKDHDTGIFVSVKSADGKMQLASISNADSSGKDMTEYNDDSYHIVPLGVDAPGATKADCNQFKVHMSIKTNGDDTWSIDLARVTLYFSDGTNLVAERANFRLVNDGASTDFSSP
jgi:hypothetical protein